MEKSGNLSSNIMAVKSTNDKTISHISAASASQFFLTKAETNLKEEPKRGRHLKTIFVERVA